MAADTLPLSSVRVFVSENRAEDVADEGTESEDLRSSLRHILPRGVSASMRTVSGRILHVSVSDISRTGACVIRRGGIDVDQDEQVILDFSDTEHQQKLSLPSLVQWVNSTTYNTQIGLRFLQGPLLPGTMLDAYFDRSLLARGGSL
jgi:hypothetical protein